MEDDIKAKQHFLREKNIEQGYDPIPFTEYLSQQRENGHDIETWSMNDLKEVVYQYIAISPKPASGPIQLPELSASENDASHDEEEKPAIKDAKAPQKGTEKDEKEKKVPEKNGLPSPTSIITWLLEEAKLIVETTTTVHSEITSINDQRQQITKMILSQSEEEKSAMNDFTLVIAPKNKAKLNELNGEKRLKIKISE